MTSDPSLIVGVTLFAVCILGGFLWRVYSKDQDEQRRNPTLPSTSESRLPIGAIVGSFLWLVIVVVVGLTLLRLAWKVFQFAWS